MHSSCHRTIGITMGCPVGIGPEIILKYLADPASCSGSHSLVIGIPQVLEASARHLGLDVEIIPWQPGQPWQKSGLHVCCPESLTQQTWSDPIAWGRPDRLTGQAMAACIEYAVELIDAGVIDAMVTCPITKSTLQQAGYDFPGHTEMLAHLCKADEYGMMMAGSTLRVTLVTIHERLASIPSLLSVQKIFSLIDLTGRSLVNDFGIQQPRIAVAGLNPHAGEDGLFGDEETRLIAPAIVLAQQAGWQVTGPLPPDTVFNRAAAGGFDVVVCMYHDQGLIPFKLLHFEDGVNVTIGLPIVRTSVDHGTAYDIAGQGIASPSSLKSAYEMALSMVENRNSDEG